MGNIRIARELLAISRGLLEDIRESLETAERDTNAHRAQRGKILDAQPDGTIVKVHGRDYVKQTLDGDIFWLSKKDGLTSIQLAVELGTKLDRLFPDIESA